MRKLEEVMKILSRPLAIEDVDFRVQSVNKGGYVTILAYKDARVDMARLDEATEGRWMRSHQLINGNLFCEISIYDEESQMWISKIDVGTESFTEKQKGEASDSFKRAGFNWGIGRELYDYPLIQFKLDNSEFKIEGGKAKPTFAFNIKDLKFGSKFNDEGELVQLAIKDKNGKLRFNWKKEK